MTDFTPGASPSSARYFYTDPLAAAWMARHFGMRFQNQNNGIEVMDRDIIRHAATGNVCRIHVHADSRHLLEPDDLDIGLDGSGYIFKHIIGSWWIQDTEANRYLEPQGLVRIIQRGGKPFFWPETEPVTASADATTA
jgi:hypothetical protein